MKDTYFISWMTVKIRVKLTRNGNILFVFTDGLVLMNARELIHTQFAKDSRKEIVVVLIFW